MSLRVMGVRRAAQHSELHAFKPTEMLAQCIQNDVTAATDKP